MGDAEHHASARALEKVGVRREGLLRRWALHPGWGETPRDGWYTVKGK